MQDAQELPITEDQGPTEEQVAAQQQPVGEYFANPKSGSWHKSVPKPAPKAKNRVKAGIKAKKPNTKKRIHHNAPKAK